MLLYIISKYFQKSYNVLKSNSKFPSPSLCSPFNFSYPPPFPISHTPIQQAAFEEQQRYSKQRRLCFSDSSPTSYNECREPLHLNCDSEQLQKLRLEKYFGCPQDFEQCNQQMNTFIFHSDKSSVSSYDKALEKLTTDHDKNNDDDAHTNIKRRKENSTWSSNPVERLKRKNNLKKLVEKYGQSPGEKYMDSQLKKAHELAIIKHA
ncbi:hypothetical protein BDC45DRAFT_529669 [Circinella umbellata]|nr:hypothetical protein BDC45DRAFT_529669 [Circinella umbellata]